MKLFNFKKFNKEKKGFTLIETLMAILIFSLSIMAVLFVISDDIADIDYAKKKMTASYLAKEGIEYMRNLRDAHTLYDAGGADTGWNSYRVKIDSCNITTNSAKSCYFTYPNLFSEGGMVDTNVSLCTGSCPTLYKSPAGGYEYDIPGAVDGYKREIKTREISSDEIEVSSTVYWYHGTDEFSITFKTVLFNWMGEGTPPPPPPPPPLAIGDTYQGGIIGYILQSGDTGYDPNVQHGIIVSTSDQATGIPWYNGSYVTTGATGLDVGTGSLNSNIVVSVQGAPLPNYAVGQARSYTGSGYTDWYLPSIRELEKLYQNKTSIGGFNNFQYWSSSEYDSTNARSLYFGSGSWGIYSKDSNYRVRAIRNF